MGKLKSIQDMTSNRICASAFHCSIFLFFASISLLVVVPDCLAADTLTFDINEIDIEGNTIFTDDALAKAVKPFIGKEKTSADVEAARGALEKYYHNKGYPTALVNIPEQSVEGGAIRLQVIESKIRRVRASGNRYFTRERLIKEMPAFRPGEILYLPAVKRQLARVNRNPDLKVAPVLKPGKKLGTIDVEFKVKDKLPLHGTLELNNRSTHDTTDLRANAMLRYDNLWQKEHSIVLQYQTAPEEPDEVQLITGSYTLPSPFNDDHVLTLYGLSSDSDTATAEGITVLGEGFIVGFRYMANLPPLESYLHDLSVGVDYKEFEEDIEGDQIKIDYASLHLSYTARVPDKGGQTIYNIGINAALRPLGSDDEAFDTKRAYAQGNYFVTMAGITRHQKLGWGWHAMLSISGQLSNDALISNEQYIAGGVNSVRGYMESEASGDEALHGTLEISTPDLGAAMGIGNYLELTPYVFYDAATLERNDALPGEDDSVQLRGAGIGVRGYMFKYLEYRVDYGQALVATADTEEDDYIVHFKAAFKF